MNLEFFLMYIYLDESRVAFHFLSSNVAGQLFEIACGQKVNFVGSLSLWSLCVWLEG